MLDHCSAREGVENKNLDEEGRRFADLLKEASEDLQLLHKLIRMAN